MQRESMVFYRSFHEATKELPPEIYKEAMVALMDYALDGELNKVSAYANMFLQMAKPQVDANNQLEPKTAKAEEEETEPEPKQNQTVTKPEPNENVNDNENVNVKENKKHSCTAEATALFERLWAEYPVKKGKGQVSDTQKKRLLAIGEPALLKAIERYRAELAKDSGWRRAQNGSTFFNSGYVDYLDGNFVPDKERPVEKKGVPNRFHNFEQRNTDYDSMVIDQTLAWLKNEEDAG